MANATPPAFTKSGQLTQRFKTAAHDAFTVAVACLEDTSFSENLRQEAADKIHALLSGEPRLKEVFPADYFVRIAKLSAHAYDLSVEAKGPNPRPSPLLDALVRTLPLIPDALSVNDFETFFSCKNETVRTCASEAFRELGTTSDALEDSKRFLRIFKMGLETKDVAVQGQMVWGARDYWSLERISPESYLSAITQAQTIVKDARLRNDIKMLLEELEDAMGQKPIKEANANLQKLLDAVTPKAPKP